MSLFIPILALIGLADASYLLYKKLKHEHLTCLIGDNCEAVVKSKYGYLGGIPNEVFGTGYYLLLLAGFLLVAFGVEALFGISIVFVLQLATVPAVVLSVYLLGIQAFVLKEWCEYCVLSAIVNILIALVLFL